MNVRPSFINPEHSLANNLAGWWRCAICSVLLLALFGLFGTAYAIPNPPPKPYLLKDIAPGTEHGITTLGYYQPLIYAGNTLYLVANDGKNGWELWRANGATNGTIQLGEINPTGNAFEDATSWHVVNDILYFGAVDGEGKSGLWKSDGTAAGTTLVKQYGFGQILQTAEMIHKDDTLYFSLYDGVTPVELWQSDGTTLGTTTLITSTYPEQLRVAGDLLYYVELNTDRSERVVWKTDGTAAGTQPVKSFTLTDAPLGFRIELLTGIDNTLYFVGYNEEHGGELWQSDGTVAGTTLVKDINPGTASAAIHHAISFNGRLYFAADDGVHGRALWQSDGTPDGTVLVKQIDLTSTSSFPFHPVNPFVAVDDHFYFVADDGVTGYELWKSDGTTAGTTLVNDLYPGPEGAFNNASRAYLTAMDGLLYFAADDGVAGLELWQSDGSAAGTTLVADLHAGPADATPSFLVNGNGTLYFAADDGQHGMELWAFNPAIAPRAYLPIVHE